MPKERNPLNRFRSQVKYDPIYGNLPESIESVQHPLKIKLADARSLEREQGCMIMAKVLESGENMEKIDVTLIQDLVKLLVDDSLDVRYSASGALRNLTIHEYGCDLLLKLDLQSLLPKSIMELLKIGKGLDDSKRAVLVQQIHLLCCLFELSDEWVEAMSQNESFVGNFIELLTDMTSKSELGFELKNETAQCFLILSEENETFSKMFYKMNGAFEAVVNSLNSQASSFYKACVSGGLFNLKTVHNFNNVIKVITPNLLKSFLFNPRLEFESIAKISEEKQRNSLYETWKERLLTQKVSLEVIGNIVSFTAYDLGQVDTEDSENEIFLQFVAQYDLVKNLLTLYEQSRPLLHHPMDLQFCMDFMDVLATCLNNLIIATPPQFLQRFKEIVMDKVNLVCTDIGNCTNYGFLEIATGLLWSIFRKFGFSESLSNSQVISTIFSLLNRPNLSSRLKTNLYALLGHFLKYINHQESIHHTVNVLLSALSQEQDIYVVTEVMNSIFEIPLAKINPAELQKNQFVSKLGIFMKQVFPHRFGDQVQKLPMDDKMYLQETMENMENYISFCQQHLCK